MSIKVKVEKYVMSDGTKGYVINEVAALGKNKLPEMYMHTYPHCYQGTDYREDHIVLVPAYDENYIYIKVGDFIPKKKFEKIIASLRVCGDKLRKVREKLRKLKEEWKGEEIYII